MFRRFLKCNRDFFRKFVIINIIIKYYMGVLIKVII